MARLHCAAFARQRLSWVGNICPFKMLVETKDAIDTRLAVYGRLRLSERTRSGATCVGVLAAQSSLQARLPHGHSPAGKGTHRRILFALGFKVSFSIRSCEQTLLRWSGFRRSIPVPFFSRRRPRRSPASATSALSRRYFGAVQTTANIGSSKTLKVVCHCCSSTIRQPQRRLRLSFRSTKHLPCEPMRRSACGKS